MQLDSQTLDALGQLLGRLGQLCVLFQHTRQQSGLLGHAALTLFARAGELVSLLSVGHRRHLVAIGLPRLGQQNQRRLLRGLQAEGKIQQNERILVEYPPSSDVN
jgi:hypothetical protein